MLRVTLRNIWAHKRRLVSTIVAILLGVAFMSGTLVLTDTLDRSFDEIFQTSSKGIDAEVRGEELFRSEEHMSELQSLMRISYAVFCLKKKKQQNRIQQTQRKKCTMQ